MLYKLNIEDNKDAYKKVKRVTLNDIGWKEKDLENLVSKNIQDFISDNDLMTIFTERPYQEEPDILALDKNGDLYIFELKRWIGKQENLLQVLRYGQKYGKSNFNDLNNLYQSYHQQGNKKNLLNDFAEYFGLNINEIPDDYFNRKQKFIILTNGLDQKTIEAIIYWKDCGLNIDAIIYWIFDINGEYYIEINKYSQIDNFLEYENNYYVLNTNEQDSENHTKEMLNEEIAAAYYPGWREKIQKLQKNDLVFLYQNSRGIVAYGYADGKLRTKSLMAEKGELKDGEYFMKLNKFKKFENNPISASEMKKIAGYGLNFRQTLYSISKDTANKMLNEAEKRLKYNN